MKSTKISKSVCTSTTPDKTINSNNPDKTVKSLINEPKTEKKLINHYKPLILNFTDNFNINNNTNIKGRFYYKNPEFYNSTNIQNQIDFLVTNIKNKPNKTISFDLPSPLPKIKKNDVPTSLKSNIKKRKSSLDSSKNVVNDQKLENIFPNISTTTSVNFNSKNLYNNSRGSEPKIKGDDYFYRNIFTNASLFKKRPHYIDNKLNLIYSQNESQYRLIINRRNKEMKEKGNYFTIEEDSEKIKNKLNSVKTKIKFMKNIMDYSYPNLMINKVQTWGKSLQCHKYDDKLTPIEEKNLLIKKRNIIRTNYLNQNLKILPVKI